MRRICIHPIWRGVVDNGGQFVQHAHVQRAGNACRKLVQFLPDLLGCANQYLGFAGFCRAVLEVVQRVFNATGNRGQPAHADRGRTARQRVRQVAGRFRRMGGELQRPFAQLMHQLARPGVGLVEVGVEQGQRNMQIANPLDFVFGQTVDHVFEHGQLGRCVDQHARDGGVGRKGLCHIMRIGGRIGGMLAPRRIVHCNNAVCVQRERRKRLFLSVLHHRLLGLGIWRTGRQRRSRFFGDNGL